METTAHASVTLPISQQKLELVADLVRGLNILDAINQLTLCKRRVSNDVLKLLESAIANAETNHGMDVDELYIDRVLTGRGRSLKRLRPRARGRGMRIIKHYSNIKLILKER